MESGDIMIQIAPTDRPGLNVELQSSVEYQFGDQIRQVITETLRLTCTPLTRAHSTAPSAHV